MKKFLIVSLAVLFAAAVVPQNATAGIGVKGQLTWAKFSLVGGDNPVFSDLVAPAVGLYWNVHFGPVTIQPELFYIRMGGRMENGADWAEYRFDYIQVPLLIKVNLLPGPISPAIFAGPYASERFSAKAVGLVGGVSESQDMNDQIQKEDYGAVFGGGIDFRLPMVKFTMEVRYNFGMANFIKNPDPGTSGKNRALMMLAGIGF